MEVTYINTLDGRTKVEWWEKEKFRNRVTEVISAHSHDRIPIPDDSILCDFCNVQITEFPVPVVWGTHALCKGCFEGVKKEGGKQDGG